MSKLKILIFSMLLAITAIAQAQNHIKPTRLLYTLASGTGSISQGKADYTLTMYLSTMKQVLTFGDRPSRFAEYISAEDLKYSWGMGKNSFKADPPNAVLSSERLRPTLVVLHSIQVKGDRVIFKFTSDYQLTHHQLKHVTLTIDSYKSCQMSSGFEGKMCGYCRLICNKLNVNYTKPCHFIGNEEITIGQTKKVTYSGAVGYWGRCNGYGSSAGQNSWNYSVGK